MLRGCLEGYCKWVDQIFRFVRVEVERVVQELGYVPPLNVDRYINSGESKGKRKMHKRKERTN